MVVLMTAGLVLGACGGDANEGESDAVTTTQDDSTTTQQAGPATTTPQSSPSTTENSGFVEIDPPLELSGSSWIITHYQYHPSSTGIVNTVGEQATLELNDDGTLTGHNGCNEFAGTWEIVGPYYDYDEGAEFFDDKLDGQGIAVAAELTTSVECDGFVGEQDFDLMGALTNADLWYAGSIAGDGERGLTLNSESGQIFADPRE